MARKLLFTYAAMALAAVALQVAFSGSIGALLVRPAARPGGLAADIGVGVGVGLLTVLGTRVSSARWAWARRIDTDFREMLAPLSARHAAPLAFMSGLAEELFFRGFLQPHLGLVVTSVAFGLVHLPPRKHQLPWTGAAVIMGFVFGGLMEARGVLLVPVLAHATINHFNLHFLVSPATATVDA